MNFCAAFIIAFLIQPLTVQSSSDFACIDGHGKARSDRDEWAVGNFVMKCGYHGSPEPVECLTDSRQLVKLGRAVTEEPFHYTCQKSKNGTITIKMAKKPWVCLDTNGRSKCVGGQNKPGGRNTPAKVIRTACVALDGSVIEVGGWTEFDTSGSRSVIKYECKYDGNDNVIFIASHWLD